MISKLRSMLKRLMWTGVLAAVAFVLILILDAVLLNDDDAGDVQVDPD